MSNDRDWTSPEGRAELRRLSEKATPEHWEVERWDLDSGEFNYHIKAIYTKPDGILDLALIATTEGDFDHPKAKVDAELITAMRNSFSALLDRVDALEAAVTAAQWACDGDDGDPWCPWCENLAEEGHRDGCICRALLGLEPEEK